MSRSNKDNSCGTKSRLAGVTSPQTLRVNNLKEIKTNYDNVYFVSHYDNVYFCVAPPSKPQNQNFQWISHGFGGSAPDRGLSICGDPRRPSVHAGSDGSDPGTARALFHALDHDRDPDRFER